jgi:hypothetical protein
MQFPPMKRTIFIEDKSFYLPFPYLLFKFRGGGIFWGGYLSLAFSPEPIISLEQIVYFPWLPNVGSEDWSVCLGKKVLDIKSAINVFWNSSFQNDRWRGNVVRKKVVGSYKNWARLSLDTVCKKTSNQHSLYETRRFLDCDTKLEWE